MDRLAHWEQVYRTRRPDQFSWFQAEATLSRQLIERVVPDRSARIIDIGAGASTLVDGLLEAGYRRLTVLDVSPAALNVTRDRVGAAGESVTWQTSDVLVAKLEPAIFDFWHDRAVFHFLTSPADRDRYVAQVRTAVRPGGYVLVATFAEDGPTRCSGLEVARYSPDALHHEFGEGFRLLECHRELHTTPSHALQAFTYCLCQVGERGPDPGRLTRRRASRGPSASR